MSKSTGDRSAATMSSQQNNQQMTTKFSPWSKDTSTRFPTDDVGGWNRDVFDPMGYLNSVGDALPLDFPVSNRTNQLMHRTQNEISKFSPILAADFFETDADYHVHLDLPGVKKDDLEVTLSNNELTIRAERKHCSEMETSHFRRRERTLGRVQRIVPVPANSNPELAQVDFVNGCLEISLPKIIPGQAYSRTLAIGSGKPSTPKGRKG